MTQYRLLLDWVDVVYLSNGGLWFSLIQVSSRDNSILELEGLKVFTWYCKIQFLVWLHIDFK